MLAISGPNWPVIALFCNIRESSEVRLAIEAGIAPTRLLLFKSIEVTRLFVTVTPNQVFISGSNQLVLSVQFGPSSVLYKSRSA